MVTSLFTGILSAQQIAVASGIAVIFAALAVVFYFVVRRLAERLAAKTGTQLDNILIGAVEWPALAFLILVGLYFATISLPLVSRLDFEVRRGFHAGYILLGGWAVVAVLAGLFRWFKAEVTPKTKTALDDWIVAVLRVVSPVLVVMTVVVLSLELYEISTSPLREWLGTTGGRIGLVLLLAVSSLFGVGIAGSKAITAFVLRAGARQSEEEVRKRADTLTAVLVTTAQVFIIVIAAFIILSEFVDIAPVLAGAGVVGIAIGFGAQYLVRDLIAGFFIVMENQYRVGDVVNIAGTGGLVEEINLRRTVLRDLDGVVHTIPNGEIKVASNLTKEYSRVNLNISVSYDTDLDRATAIINRICREMAEEPTWVPLIIKTPQVLRVDKLGDSGIDLKVVGDTKPIQQWAVMGEIRKRVKKAFDQEGVEIPWPHTKVYFGNSPQSGDVGDKDR
jgi:small conductance mechanosensitive channel